MCDIAEDHPHILQCQSAQASTHFITAYGALDEWLVKTTSEEIAEAVYLLISDYKERSFESNQLYEY